MYSWFNATLRQVLSVTNPAQPLAPALTVFSTAITHPLSMGAGGGGGLLSYQLI